MRQGMGRQELLSEAFMLSAAGWVVFMSPSLSLVNSAFHLILLQVWVLGGEMGQGGDS